MNILKSPRLWLFIWGGAGALVLAYVMIAASVQPSGPKGGKESSVYDQDQSFLTGEMADFEYAFPPRPAPQASFVANGENLFVSSFKGKVVLVNFWATWCAPCLKELPSLDALQGEFDGSQFEVVAIAADPKGPAVAEEFLEKLEIKNLNLYADPRLRLASSIGGANVLPVSILYGPDSMEIGRLVGEADWTSPEAKALIESAIVR